AAREFHAAASGLLGAHFLPSRPGGRLPRERRPTERGDHVASRSKTWLQRTRRVRSAPVCCGQDICPSEGVARAWARSQGGGGRDEAQVWVPRHHAAEGKDLDPGPTRRTR